MTRVHGYGHRSVIQAALDVLTPAAREQLGGLGVIAGADPHFIGLHVFRDTSDDRSYSDIAHVCYGGVHTTETVIVMPVLEPLWVVIHELGHVIHERLGWLTPPEPVSEYAAEDRYEAFAEAWTMSYVRGYETSPLSLERLRTWLRERPGIDTFFGRAYE